MYIQLLAIFFYFRYKLIKNIMEERKECLSQSQEISEAEKLEVEVN